MQRKSDTKKIATLSAVPEHLQAELDQVDWKNIKSAWGRCEELPAEINGLLSADEEVGIECENGIWQKMTYHGELFDATYATATIIARMLPILLAIRPILFADIYINYKKVRTEGSRTALLALAELGEKDPDFLKRHNKLLMELELPSNAQQIKEMAAQ